MNQDLCITSEEKFVRAMANSHTHELGFIPHSVYGQALTRGTLRVTPEGADFIGFVLHGPVKFHTRIWQTFTVEHRRRDAIATAAVDSLLREMHARNFERVSCWVADDLEALKFWRAVGFFPCGTRGQGELHKRPATQLQFRFTAGEQIDQAIATARKRGKAAELLQLFAMEGKFEKTITRRERRKR